MIKNAFRIGRRVVYFISLSLLTFGRLGSLFVVDWYPIFVAVSTIATISSTSVFQSTVVIIMELSNTEDRAFVAQISNLGWTTGLCLLPLIFWIVEDWKYYVLVSTVPLLFYFPLTM